eukprot:6193740-Pleurochrysis_carterae.AAC.3
MSTTLPVGRVDTEVGLKRACRQLHSHCRYAHGGGNAWRKQPVLRLPTSDARPRWSVRRL